MSEDNLPILVATDRPQEAEVIARDLGEEFARVQVSTDPRRCVQDFELFKPAVLVLAFNSLDKAMRHLLQLRQAGPMAKAPPHRVLILCGQDDVREVYELCRKDHFDEFLLFWPASNETRPLRMAVRRALAQAVALRGAGPGTSDFAARARKLAALEPLLEAQVLRANGNGEPDDELAPLLESVRALRALAERSQPLVLVVDDDKFQHKLLGQLLAQVKAEVACSTTAAEAICSLHKRRPDLILMDVSLPGVDGIEATRLLKSGAQFAAIPVIMITGVGGKAVVVDSLKAGAADFVVKPFNKDILLGKVRKVLYGRAMP